MQKILIAVVVVIASFFAGMWVQRMDQTDLLALQTRLEKQSAEKAVMTQKNEELGETLAIVKRQVQTDRIAYQSLQEVVDASTARQTELQTQLQQARDLMGKLRDRMEANQTNQPQPESNTEAN